MPRPRSDHRQGGGVSSRAGRSARRGAPADGRARALVASPPTPTRRCGCRRPTVPNRRLLARQLGRSDSASPPHALARRSKVPFVFFQHLARRSSLPVLPTLSFVFLPIPCSLTVSIRASTHLDVPTVPPSPSPSAKRPASLCRVGPALHGAAVAGHRRPLSTACGGAPHGPLLPPAVPRPPEPMAATATVARVGLLVARQSGGGRLVGPYGKSKSRGLGFRTHDFWSAGTESSQE